MCMMTEEKNLIGGLWFQSHNHHTSSLTGGWGVLVSFGMSAILMLGYCWFLLRPYQFYSDLLAPSHADPTFAPPEICDLSRGEWVPDTSPPLYSNATCNKYINPLWDCQRNGRPDSGYLHWKWQPSDCELPRFNASYFLELLRGKKLALIGDSLARNHGLSLICALTQVEDPEHEDWKDRWFFASFNFTLVIVWSPYLVQYSFAQEDPDHLQHDDAVKIHLDIPDGAWTSQLQEYAIAIISSGYWYFRRSIYLSNNTILGASADARLNITTFDFLTAWRMAMGTALRYMVKEYQGITMLRTVTVDHFEYGVWNDGGRCQRTGPFSSQEAGINVPQKNNEMNKVQVEEFKKARALVNGSPKLQLLDVTHSVYMRPDGHPGPYRKEPPYEPPNDCLHWCLPGPVDMWNQQVLHALQPIYITRTPLT